MCSSCRWATTLSCSTWSYSFEHVVSVAHGRSVAMWWLSLNTINWSYSVFNYLWVIWIFFRQISMTRLIWILSTILVLIYSTQIKFLVNNSWILWHSWLSWNWSLHRIVHNLSFNLTFRMSKLQANFSWWLTLIIWIITSLLVHVSSGAIYDARLGNSIILLISIGIHPFVLLSINRWLFWNVLLIGLLVAILSLMI